MTDAPPDPAPRATPSRRPGAARADAVPRMETVRITEPDLQRRAALEKTRSRLLYAAFGFALLFLAVIAKLADATIIQPLSPHRPERPIGVASMRTTSSNRSQPVSSPNGSGVGASRPSLRRRAG